MTLHDRDPARQPRRLGLYGPFALLVLAIAAWSVAWIWLRHDIYRRMDAERSALSRLGYELHWGGRSLRGYPFRLDLDLSDVSLAKAGGWRLTTPGIAAETTVLSPGHWVMVFPAEITRTSADGANVVIRGRTLRASLSDEDAHPPRISIEGLDIAIDGPAAANPFFFSRAREFHFHTKAGPDDLGAVYLEVDEAIAKPTSLVGGIAGEKPVTLVADSIFTHAHALAPPDWRTSVEAWRKAGGEFDVRSLKLSAGATILDAKPGTLTVDDGGRLHGSLSVTSGATVSTTVDFGSTGTRLGSASFAAPPKVY